VSEPNRIIREKMRFAALSTSYFFMAPRTVPIRLGPHTAVSGPSLGPAAGCQKIVQLYLSA
jgi:hypothetical protein